jgi:hypothetical protein
MGFVKNTKNSYSVAETTIWIRFLVKKPENFDSGGGWVCLDQKSDPT